MTNTNKYSFEGWLIEWDADEATVFLSLGRYSCSLGCAEGEGVASDGDLSIEVPDEVIAMAQELEDDCAETEEWSGQSEYYQTEHLY